MLTIEEIRKIVPEANQLSDRELIKLRDSLYPAIQKIIDRYIEESDKI